MSQPPPPKKPMVYYIAPSGMAEHAAFACSGSAAHDAAMRDLDRRQGRGGSSSAQGPGGAHRTDDPFDLVFKACCFGCSMGCALCWESCGGNPAADAGVAAAAAAALASPSESLLFLGRPLHGSACCWCTSDPHPFWSMELFNHAVSAGMMPASAIDVVEGLDGRLAAARGDLSQLAQAMAPGGPAGTEVAVWAASLGVSLKMEELQPGGRWVVKVSVRGAARQAGAPKQQVMG